MNLQSAYDTMTKPVSHGVSDTENIAKPVEHSVRDTENIAKPLEHGLSAFEKALLDRFVGLSHVPGPENAPCIGLRKVERPVEPL